MEGQVKQRGGRVVLLSCPTETGKRCPSVADQYSYCKQTDVCDE